MSAENRENDEEERKNHEEDEEEYESSLAYSVLLSFPFLSIFRVISFQYLSSLSFPLLYIFQVISFQYLPPPSHFSFLSPSFELFPFRSLLRVSLGLPKKNILSSVTRQFHFRKFISFKKKVKQILFFYHGFQWMFIPSRIVTFHPENFF